MNYERRAFPLEFRISEDGPTKIVGHAAVFDSLSEEMGSFFGSFRERIAPGAFDEALARVRSGADEVYALFNHDPSLIIAATADQSLSLSVDDRGLVAEMTPMNTQTVNDLVVQPMREGKLRKMSFGFVVAENGDHFNKAGDEREITNISRLFDVSVVTWPAYPATDAQARSLLAALHVDVDSLSTPERAAVRSFIASVARHMPQVRQEDGDMCGRADCGHDFAVHEGDGGPCTMNDGCPAFVEEASKLPAAASQVGRASADPIRLAGVSPKLRRRLLELQDRDFALALTERN